MFQCYLVASISEFWNHLGKDLLEVAAASLCNVALQIVVTLLENPLEIHVRN